MCNYTCSLKTLGLSDEVVEKAPKENIQEAIRYIKSLPVSKIRGLSFPTDSGGYYLVWPRDEYYKFRPFKGASRYRAPHGHRSPLLFLGPTDTLSLVVVEGEINALSLAEVTPNREYAIASPGSCNELIKHLPEYLTYPRIFVIVDKDNPGVATGLELKHKLVSRGKRVKLIAVDRDFNDVLVQEGKEALKLWSETNLVM